MALEVGGLLTSSSPNSPPSLQVAPHPADICPFHHCFSSIQYILRASHGLRLDPHPSVLSPFCMEGINNMR